MLRIGVKLAYVAPVVLTLNAHQAMTAGSNPSGTCSTLLHTGAACTDHNECCTGTCTLHVCE